MTTLIRAPPILFPATAKHTATVIFVHGLDDTGRGWAGAVENWRRRQRLDEVKFILPHAPAIPITCNWGMKMTGWYDIHTLDGNAESLRSNEDEAGILLSQAYFHELIQQEVDAGIPPERIVLGGFSQGGAMSLFAGLTARVKLAGIVALSSYLLLSLKFADLVRQQQTDANRDTPVFMAHGDSDKVVHPELGKKSFDLLDGLGYNVKLKIYKDMGHSACLEELDDVEAFLRERLPASGDSDAKPEL
ncbi:Phospholipase/carboxylesterase [Parathielavia hyrcaniae]|uniref:Acyl-protein thioesterase 1 n=1 Tax=Parathielavia hyrcaniae TaxID=113614 RepID=A0AAN6Q376_9PEZI|nr:Phospholipase/carboxylesterase [Parathielavia hyrcaniae]